MTHFPTIPFIIQINNNNGLDFRGAQSASRRSIIHSHHKEEEGGKLPK